MRKVLFILLALAIPSLLLAAEPMREWKFKSGNTIMEASLDDTKKNDDPKQVYLVKDGKRYKVSFDKLSKADQDYVTRVRSSRDVIPLAEESRGIEIVPAGKRYALLIGVNEYAKPIKSLRFCVNDIKLLAESFEKIGVPKENIFLVTDDSPAERRPTGENIRQQIEIVTQLMEPNDQLTIAFSGHGAMVDGKSYLCPSDTNLDNVNSIISRDWAFSQLEHCKAKQKIFIIDACRDEVSFGDQRALGGTKTLEDPIGADTHGFILIASCDKKQKSWEHENLKHGVFTFFLAEGLAGAAKDEDGYVSIMNLFQYASSKTKKYVYREFNKAQVPTFRQSDEMTDFCLAKVALPTPPTTTPGTVVEPQADPEPAPVQTSLLDAPGAKAGERKTVTVNGIEFAFCWCPAGTFMMGPEDGNQHLVKLTNGFWMMEMEVTQKQWKAIMGTNPSRLKGDDLPVERVTWEECQKFCTKCAELGLPVELPTEAQWEYACRAGSITAYSWGNALNGDKANCNGNDPYGTTIRGKNLGKTAPVGSYQPNSWGLYDMHGNVAEWCSDWYDNYPNESVTDPTGPPSARGVRVVRGGAWNERPRYCLSSSRTFGGTYSPYDGFGFRCVRTITSPK